jgi:hypothetical protein
MRLHARLVVSLAACVGLAAAPSPARAQGELTIYQDLGKVPDGAYSKYRLDTGGGGPAEMTVAVVGRAADAIWLETTLAVPQRGDMTVKLLIAPKAGEQFDVKRMIVQWPGGAPTEFAADNPNRPRVVKADQATYVGEEPVKVTAGTFKAKHYRKVDGDAIHDAWIAPTVLPISVVKTTVTKKGEKPLVTLELLATGKDAKTKVTGEPKPAPTAPGGSAGPAGKP